ncbi:MAG: hypothetical protein HXY24_08360 [Rubrivivax sp.]|nr:hypothetical protein [Rubrivivax sp.]
MKSAVRVPLNATPQQAGRLLALQREFAAVCNALAPIVQQTRTWNRVALHHIAYKQMRERFPALGSQMVCNAIYSVSRAARLVFQSPTSPFRLQRLGSAPLPLLRFADTAPVFFDRHTLSIKAGELSMFTLDGRMRFQLGLAPEVEQRFRQDKLREIVLAQSGGRHELVFHFEGEAAAPRAPQADNDLPQYLLVLSAPATAGDRPTVPAAMPALFRGHRDEGTA